jgi:multidrug resistance efflux pump
MLGEVYALNPSRPARRRWWLLALALAAGSLAGFGHFMAVALRGAPTAEAVAERQAVRTVVCFGLVDLETGVRELHPTMPGRVAAVLVREGETVPAGAVLLRMEDSQARQHVAQAQAALDAAKAELDQGRTLPEQHHIALEQARAAIKVAEAQRNVAEETLARKQELARINYTNTRELTIAQEELKAAQQALLIKEAELQNLGLRDPHTAVRLLEIKVAQADALLKQAKAALDDFVLTAPAAGTVLRVTVGHGDTLAGPPRQSAIQFCPEGPRIIRAQVEQAFASLIAEGQVAKVEDDTHAGGTWTGRVQHVSDWYSQKRATLQDPLQFNDVRTLEFLVALDPGQPKLRLNQRVRVTVQIPSR